MGPRRRASTVKGSNEELEELSEHLKQLSVTVESDDHPGSFERVVAAAHTIRQCLLNGSKGGPPQDAFRYLGGFQTLLDTLKRASQNINVSDVNTDHASIYLELFQNSFEILTAALRSHKGNKRYFRERIKHGGWSVLEEVLAYNITAHQEVPSKVSNQLIARGNACLLACALDDESATDLFSSSPSEEPHKEELADSNTELRSLLIKRKVEEFDEPDITQSLAKKLGPSPSVVNADALVVLFKLWKTLQQLSFAANESTVPSILVHLASSSTRNLVAMHETPLLSILLLYLCELIPERKHEAKLMSLATRLLDLGIRKLDDAYLLFRHARASPAIAQLLSSSLMSSQVSSYVHFDLSMNGYVSIELPGIAHAFPPMSNSNGYTLTMWFQVVSFDSKSHTTLFGAFDASQSCFVLVYVEKDTHHLILQTSIKSSRPSVRFKSISFKEGCWYHVALVHKRPKTTSSAKASLFVNGEFVEQVKSQYPAIPARLSAEADVSGTSGETQARNPVQTFLGTPQDLASRLGKNLVTTQWRLASAQLFSETLSDDLLAVYYRLGPKYTGNYQDCLGSFQTYEASAQLNIRNESLHPGKEERSELVLAIRAKAGDLLPEAKILLNVSAASIYGEIDLSNISGEPILQSLSRTAYRSFYTVTQGGRNAIALNGAYPAIDQALLNQSGYAVLTGDPTRVSKTLIDDATWRIGGCTPVCLALVDGAEDADTFISSLRIFLLSIQDNWRNSEAVERENGFGILANMIASKLKRFDSVHMSNSKAGAWQDSIALSSPSMRTLQIVLGFLGYWGDQPEDSVINNPLAYRTLIIDLDTWRNSNPQVQKLYYDQIVVFAHQSKYHHFNNKRLTRMRIAKKWLEMLKYQPFTTTTFGYFLRCFEVLLSRNFTAEIMRSLALFITYAIYNADRRRDISRKKSTRLKAGTPTRRRTISASSPADTTSTKAMKTDDADPSELGLPQVAVGMLQLYTTLLFQRNDVASIQRFAKTVTNKWLLYLLADSQDSIVIEAVKILSRLLTLSGPSYMGKFVDKTGGMTILRYRLQRHWHMPAIWLACFAVLFGRDATELDFQKFDLFTLVEAFAAQSKIEILSPEILPVLMALLREGVLSLTRDEPDVSSSQSEREAPNSQESADAVGASHSRQRSLTVTSGTAKPRTSPDAEKSFAERSAVIHAVIRFLADIHTKSRAFRDLAANSSYIQELFMILFPVVVSANAVTAETELNARNSALTFKGGDVVMKPIATNQTKSTPVVRTAPPDGDPRRLDARPQAPKRTSSYVLVTSQSSQEAPKLQPAVSPKRSRSISNVSNSIVQEILELVLSVFCDQIFTRKEFPGLGLFMRVPPGFQEHQAYFETFILRNAVSQISNHIKLNQKLLWDPRVLTNLSRLSMHLAEAIYEGWFIDGASVTFDFLASILEYLQLPDVVTIKSVRLCSGTVTNMRALLFRIMLLRLSELDEGEALPALRDFLNKLAYWQTALLPANEPTEEFIGHFCFLLLTRLSSSDEQVRMAAANLWRLLLVHKHEEISSFLLQTGASPSDPPIHGFKKIMELDNETFIAWFEDHRSDVVKLFAPLSKAWSAFVGEENRRTEHTAKARIAKRRERLKVWAAEEFKAEEATQRHETSGINWRSNIYGTEHYKCQRTLQDQQDNRTFIIAAWKRMYQDLCRPCGLFEDAALPRWQLDQTEGRNRMRMRFIPEARGPEQGFQPKRRQSQGPIKHRLSLSASSTPARGASPMPSQTENVSASSNRQPLENEHKEIKPTAVDGEDQQSEEEFEIVDDPTAELEEFDDKNRKVMRSIQRGDQVEFVHNASRIVGLEAVEGILIVGKQHLYILDNLFQRLDGEIVNVTNAPNDERDPYLQMISGQKKSQTESAPSKTDFDSRHWSWDEILSISKRRFLFRDVAIEIFFVDGRSYLLTSRDPLSRDELYQRLLAKAPISAANGTTSSEQENWRADSIRNTEEMNQSLGARFTNVFAHQASNPATKKWAKGEMSNFHYLMLVNTMAGRTFNDLTQYPVFPWVLADYTSEELDLSDPRSFRDLSKPMGCQTLERQADFKDRYQSFAEMGDENAPPFHYGTHYSSAMIVTSYLIRLQPFVHSYLLLQGGYFDHPDRLFYSIGKAWNSASRTNMTDVRELIPEFYYLPEFLSNVNSFDFGERQGGENISNVGLPPWAKGDPKVFIAKHREALESDYVSQNLHGWIDLIFGHKQRGDAALEATNVFHHLSYHGAKDLDTIFDPVERLATIGIIHNFGQTPHQIFTRPHATRELVQSKPKRLDTSAETLTRLPFPVLESQARISSLQWSTKHEKVLQSGPLRLNMGPSFDKYLEWGFFDGSIRFFMSDSRKLVGLFEHVHIDSITTALFADSRTLITAGNDCTISAWSIISSSKLVDLQPRKTLFGHRTAINNLAVSRSFSTLLSASIDGQVILWDLNRMDLVRVLTIGKAVECARINDVTGHIVVCRGSEVSLWTLNGDLLLKQEIQSEGDDTISSCAFYEGNGHEYLERQLVFTGHRRGVVNVWSIEIREGFFVLNHIKNLHHMDQAGFNIGAAITAILPTAQAVYTGDDDGRVYEWDCLQRQ